MGINVDAHICYGILIGDPYERLPWHDENDTYDRDIEEWWEKAGGFKPTFYPYDAQGNSAGFATTAQVETYWEERRDWQKANPCPVQEVRFGHAEQDMIILAIPSRVKGADWGTPTEITHRWCDTPTQDHYALLRFCEKHGIDTQGAEPKWWLSALMS